MYITIRNYFQVKTLTTIFRFIYSVAWGNLFKRQMPDCILNPMEGMNFLLIKFVSRIKESLKYLV